MHTRRQCAYMRSRGRSQIVCLSLFWGAGLSATQPQPWIFWHTTKSIISRTTAIQFPTQHYPPTLHNFCNSRISQVFHIFLETKCHFCTPIARQLLTRSWLSNCHNAKVCPSQQTTGPPGVVTLTWGWLFTSSLQSLRWRNWWWLARVLKAGILAKILPITLTRYIFPRFTY